MRTAKAEYRPVIRSTQTVTRRSVKPTRLRATRLKPVPRKSRTLRQRVTPRRHAQLVAVRPQGLSVFSLLALVAIGLALTFVLSLNWQRQAYQVNQQEVALRSKLYQTANESRQLVVDQQRALGPRENELRSQRGKLAPVKLEERTVSAKLPDKLWSFSGKPKANNPEPAPGNSRSPVSPTARSSR